MTWTATNTNQTPNWQTVPNTQTPNWQPVTT